MVIKRNSLILQFSPHCNSNQNSKDSGQIIYWDYSWDILFQQLFKLTHKQSSYANICYENWKLSLFLHIWVHLRLSFWRFLFYIADFCSIFCYGLLNVWLVSWLKLLIICRSTLWGATHSLTCLEFSQSGLIRGSTARGAVQRVLVGSLSLKMKLP